MDVAIVTGASSTLGLAISRRLIDLGFRVYGLGGNFADIPLRNSAFVPVNCNLADPGQVEGSAREIIGKERAVCLVVNNAKLYPPEDLTRATTDQLERSLAVNLLCPLVLLREALPGLQRLQGQIVNIASATPETGRGGPAGAATAGALRWMGEQLFQQLRETGVKVTTISPEPNRWRPTDTTPAPGQRPQSVIDPDAVAACVADLVSNRSGNVITEIVLRPQRIVEKPQEPVRELPYPKPQPIPYTVPRAEIEADEQLDEEKEIARERREGRGQPDAHGTEGGRRGRRRSRGRRGKGEGEERRDEKRRQPAHDKPATQPEPASTAPERGEGGDPAREPRKAESPRDDACPPESPRQSGVEEGAAASGNRRKRRRKPRPSAMGINVDQPPFAATGDRSKPKSLGTGGGGEPPSSAPPEAAAAASRVGEAPVGGESSAEAPPESGAMDAAPLSRRTPEGADATARKTARKGVKKAARKAAVKKAVKKAAGKSAAKKTSQRKTAAKKTTVKKAAAKKAPRKTAKKKAEQA